MKRLSLQTENQWEVFSDGCGIDLLRLSGHSNKFTAAIAVTLLGFGVGLTYWKRAAREWTPVAPISPARSYAWEPIETDGSCGMEHAP